MSLETAIRKALERVGPGADPEQRARVYQSARLALENGMRQQNITDAAIAAEQRRQLEAAINRVERDAKLDYMEHEAKQRAVREAAEREERGRRELQMAEQARMEAELARERNEQARVQAERDAEMRRRREEIDRERIAREMEYEAAQRALRDRIAAREQAARERALAEREQMLAAEREEEEARRAADDARRHAAEQAEREAEARRRALEEQAEREEAIRAQAERERLAREQAAREFAERQAAEREREAQERERLAREESERQAAEQERERRERDRFVREEAERRVAEETARRAEEADLARRAEAAATGALRPPLAEAETRAAAAAIGGMTRREIVGQGAEPSIDDAPAVEIERTGRQRDPVFDIIPEVEDRGERRAPAFDIEVSQPPYVADEAEPEPEVIHLPPERAIKPRRKSRWKARAFALVTFAAFGAAGWWWVQSTGLNLPKAVRDGSVPNPPPTAKAEDFDGAKQLKSLSRQGGFGDEWTKLFEAGKSKSFSVGSQASAKVEQSGSGPYLAITSAAPGIDGSVSIELPQSVITSMQGKTSNIALMLEGGDKPVQVTVECEFGGLGNCGRHRFLLSQNKTDLMFDVVVKGGNPAEGPGRLVINAGAGGEGNTARLFSIHVLPGG
ncbi:hypothetical protein ABID16_002025 [Rhizobium aquaticum]|uniref:Uncharacterized protein n=1 Tax=Rhizobium aquaticum TaxID=1549636 RepID=A0ABV2IZ33_9HYPH